MLIKRNESNGNTIETEQYIPGNAQNFFDESPYLMSNQRVAAIRQQNEAPGVTLYLHPLDRNGMPLNNDTQTMDESDFIFYNNNSVAVPVVPPNPGITPAPVISSFPTSRGANSRENPFLVNHEENNSIFQHKCPPYCACSSCSNFGQCLTTPKAPGLPPNGLNSRTKDIEAEPVVTMSPKEIEELEKNIRI